LRTVVTAAEIPASGELRVAAGAIVTPSARDLAIERGVKIVELAAGQLPAVAPPEKTVALGADHGGFQMKELLKPVLAELGFAVYDCGVAEETPADYPDIALKVAEMVAGGQAARV